MSHPKNCLRIESSGCRGQAWFVCQRAWLTATIAAGCLGITPTSHAQFGDNAVVFGDAQPVFQLTAQQYDSWVFNGQVNGKQWEAQLRSQLNTRIDYIDQICKLSELQKQKLMLAGRYDIQSFADEYESLKQTLIATTYGADQVNTAFAKVQPLQLKWQTGIFNDSSLIYKVLPRVLSSEQVAKYQQEELKRRKFRYMAKVKLSLAALENTLPFSAKQRQQLEELILAETPPPKRWGQYDHQIVLLQASKLPEAKLKKIFPDDAQYERLKAVLAQGQGMEQMLVQQGWIEESK